MKRRHFLALPGALCLSAPSWAGNTVLRYETTPSDARWTVPPTSVFHAWAAADAEADLIVERWKREPLTVPLTRLQLDRHVKHKISPTRAARGLALLHVAMHDARQCALDMQMNPRLVVPMAAAQVMGYLFNAEEKAFDRIATCVAARVSGAAKDSLSNDTKAALKLGESIGQQVVRHGDTDGAQRGWNGVRLQYYGEGRYFGPSSWEPTEPYHYYPPDEPFAPQWRTWSLVDNAEFRPKPPEYGSPRHMADLEEVIRINKNLTPEELRIAKFWVDGHGSVTPPGHWNNIAIDEALAAKLDEETTTRLFLHLNVAMADGFIACWETKYHYWTARPITAAKRLLNVTFRSAILTPPFPGYTSGHATFSGAGGRVIGTYIPSRSAAMEAMAEEAALSRLLGGIHFRHDNDDGLMTGRKVAQKVLKLIAA
ncbi:vanadium-dependent haloperoxidase [Roseateles amylovorans]|uniref:Vanadium-dependent haloperoxidase n=1 Tax=Roseateles amylovorans TaxID=2978473 RepID=A0ABY6ATB2_9BURK|nr:vanadium-dependent haloperoxidase [Roseateles amylovorans]UXH76072.1 vanadium-dependent haloperoxidase [Roseateles amylovorans]